jgi:hypothetical protein
MAHWQYCRLAYRAAQLANVQDSAPKAKVCQDITQHLSRISLGLLLDGFHVNPRTGSLYKASLREALGLS